jgi:hypothetical protein
MPICSLFTVAQQTNKMFTPQHINNNTHQWIIPVMAKNIRVVNL